MKLSEVEEKEDFYSPTLKRNQLLYCLNELYKAYKCNHSIFVGKPYQILKTIQSPLQRIFWQGASTVCKQAVSLAEPDNIIPEGQLLIA
jgi:hypothetical protein